MTISIIQQITRPFRWLHGMLHGMFRQEPEAKFEAFSATNCGKVRPNNEDSLFISKTMPFYAVCDGMGGASAGEVASSMMVEALEQELDVGIESKEDHDRTIIQAAKQVNNRIRGYISEHGLKAMGTTLVCLRIDSRCPKHGVVFHAGDSRAYRVRNNMVEQLTNDHSYARKANIDESKLTMKQRNALTNAIGIGKTCYLERSDIEVQVGDVFILCSDGLYKCVNNEKLLKACIAGVGMTAEELGNKLIQMALDGGGRDNVSVVVVKVITLEVPRKVAWKDMDDMKRGECIDIGWRNTPTPHTA